MDKKILLAEDDERIVQVVKLILENEGYTILTARNAKEVHDVLSHEQPQLLLLDISLGGSDGSVLAKELKKDPATQSLPIVIASANSDTEVIAKESGADNFLLKPFEIDTLLSLVRQYS